MKSWMFKYPYDSNTHYKELLKDLDEPTNYKETYEIFEKVRQQYFDEHYDLESDEYDRLMRELYIRRRTFLEKSNFYSFFVPPNHTSIYFMNNHLLIHVSFAYHFLSCHQKKPDKIGLFIVINFIPTQ